MEKSTRMTTIIEFMLDQENYIRGTENQYRIAIFYDNILKIMNAAAYRLGKNKLSMNYIERCMDSMFDNNPDR